MSDDKPTARELAFVEHPDALLDPVKAYIDCGYSAESAKHHAYRLRKKFEFELVERARARLEGLAVTPTWIKNEVAILAKTAMADFLEFVESKNGNQELVLKRLIDIDPDKWRAAIKEVEFDTIMMAGGDEGATLRSRVKNVVLYDRQKAIMDLARLLGMTDARMLAQQVKPQHEANQDEIQKNLIKYATVDELKEISEVFERISERLNKRADKLRDDRALEHDDGSTKRTD
jgi:hypothetical protein